MYKARKKTKTKQRQTDRQTDRKNYKQTVRCTKILPNMRLSNISICLKTVKKKFKKKPLWVGAFNENEVKTTLRSINVRKCSGRGSTG